MPVLELQRIQNNILALYVSIQYRGHSWLAPFVVDTASAVTFIAPSWEGKIRETINGEISFTGMTDTAGLVVGNLSLHEAHGFKLMVDCTDGQQRHLNAIDKPVVHFGRPGMILRILTFLKQGINVPYNILGRDVLNRWSLFQDPSTNVAFLVETGSVTQEIDAILRRTRHFTSYFALKAPPPIRFLDEEGHQIPD